MSSLQIYQWVCQWNNFENRLTFGEVMGKSLVSCFFETQCTCYYLFGAHVHSLNCFFVDNELCALLSCVNVCARHMYFTVNLLTYLLTYSARAMHESSQPREQWRFTKRPALAVWMNGVIAEWTAPVCYRPSRFAPCTNEPNRISSAPLGLYSRIISFCADWRRRTVTPAISVVTVANSLDAGTYRRHICEARVPL